MDTHYKRLLDESTPSKPFRDHGASRLLARQPIFTCCKLNILVYFTMQIVYKSTYCRLCRHHVLVLFSSSATLELTGVTPRTSDSYLDVLRHCDWWTHATST